MATRITVAVNGHRSAPISGSDIISHTQHVLDSMAAGYRGPIRLLFSGDKGAKEEELESTNHQEVAKAIRRHL